MTDVFNKAGAVIIPVCGRYSYFADRNFTPETRFSHAPFSLQWFLKYYTNRDSIADVVAAIPPMHSLTTQKGFSREMSSPIQQTYISADLKPKDLSATYFNNKPAIVGVNIASNFNNFDTTKSDTKALRDNYMVNDANIGINGLISRALDVAINQLKPNINDLNNIDIKRTIYITPLFHETGYIPSVISEANPNWVGVNYINSVLMALAPYKLDAYNVHIFHITPKEVI